MLEILFRRHVWLVRRSYLLGVKQRPVDRLKERVTLNVDKTGLRVTAETFRWTLNTTISRGIIGCVW